MKHVISIGFSENECGFDEIVDIFGQQIRVTSYCGNSSLELVRELIKKYAKSCDVICISGLPPEIKNDQLNLAHPDVALLKSMGDEIPIVNGQKLKSVFIPWAIRQVNLKRPDLLKGKQIAFYSGGMQLKMLDALEDIGRGLVLADPFLFLGMPLFLKGKKSFNRFAKMAGPFLKKINLDNPKLANFDLSKVKNVPGLKRFFNSDVFASSESMFKRLDLTHLKGKVVLVDFLGQAMHEKLKKAGVSEIVTLLPAIEEKGIVNFPILEAILYCMKEDSGPLTDDDILEWIGRHKINAKVESFHQGQKDKEKFAFIIHPLSSRQLFMHPLLRPFIKVRKPIEGLIESAISFSPGFYWGSIKGIVSEHNGKEIEGLIYTVTETPKKLMESEPNLIYKKLVGLCEKAGQRGAGIIGLGAYTKIVGDAGVTVADRSPIPVTTGNSLSACATLWAAKFALEKLGFVKESGGKYQGRVMIIGATGSIGAVSAKVLANKWKEIVLVAPRAYKLLELKEEILKIAPDAQVHISTNPEKYSPSSDLIITTTSSRGAKILDIEKVRPGCIICDVSRPFDIKEEDALKRPDVMVIASGEVQLPGKIKMNVDIGLEGNIVYACLAETALLAMEGKLESFTLSRNINYQKVLEIDQMAHKHGVRLSCIMGHNGFITDQEFELCKEHALAKRS